MFGNEKCKFFNNEIAGDSHFHFKVFVENIAMHGRLLTFYEVMKGYFKRDTLERELFLGTSSLKAGRFGAP